MPPSPVKHSAHVVPVPEFGCSLFAHKVSQHKMNIIDAMQVRKEKFKH